MPNVPTITPGPDDAEYTPEGATETIPLITNVNAEKQSGRTNDTAEISDEEAYAKLKAKRAERRRKKLIRRGIAAGVALMESSVCYRDTNGILYILDREKKVGYSVHSDYLLDTYAIRNAVYTLPSINIS